MIEQLNILSAQWWNYFIPLLIQNTLFLAVIYGLLVYLKKISAQTRYSIALLGLIKLLIPAFIPISYIANQRFTEMDLAVVQVPVVLASPTATQSPQIPINATAIALLVCFSITLIMVATPLISLGRMRYRLRQAKLIDDSSYISNQNIRVYKTDCVTLPMTIGILSKRIYVPTMWDSWPQEHRKMAILHEMNHINRHDGLISGLQMVAQAVYFFHPLVWLLNRQINEIREMACDETAAKDWGNSSVRYSSFLVEMAENMVRSQVDCPTLNGLLKKKKELLCRIQYLLEDKMQINQRSVRLLIPALTGLALLLSWNCQDNSISDSNKIIQNEFATQSAMSKNIEDTRTPEEKEKMRADLAETKAFYKSEPKNKIQYIPYDTPPEPIGGYSAIQANVVYPKLAISAGIEGTVIVHAFVDETGTVDDAIILKGFLDTGLDGAAIEAIEKTAFKPAFQKGLPVGVWIAVPINFKLEKDNQLDKADG